MMLSDAAAVALVGELSGDTDKAERAAPGFRQLHSTVVGRYGGTEVAFSDHCCNCFQHLAERLLGVNSALH
jgi:hypothetical protein